MPQQVANGQPAPIRPRYIGYLQRPTGRPVLVFTTGFLVLDDPDPVRCGWTGYDLSACMQTSVADTVVESFSMISTLPDMFELTFNAVRDQFVTECTYQGLGLPLPPGPEKPHFVLVDTSHFNDHGNAAVYVFLDTKLVRANDPNSDPRWREANALQVTGPFDAEGRPTQHAHIETMDGVTIYIGRQHYVYLGYVQSGQQPPTLVFDGGFLVQASANRAAIGWHSHAYEHQIYANVDEGYADCFVGGSMFSALWDTAHGEMKKRMQEQALVHMRGKAAAKGANDRLLWEDAPDLDMRNTSSFYIFPGPLMRAVDPGFAAGFDAAYAAKALGAIGDNGLPVHHPVVAPVAGVVHIG